MRTAIVTGSGGLIGSETCRQLIAEGYKVVGIDNDMRRYFFGTDGTTQPITDNLRVELGRDFHWVRQDIRSYATLDATVEFWRPELVVHCAAQPSHDWAAREPLTDFGVNAVGTLNLLEATRQHAPEATFVHCSTSKVYGDNPNKLPLVKRGQRLDLPKRHRFYDGITTEMSIDGCLHSLFGVSKASGDLLVQEYGRYFGMNTVCFRPGCLTGSDHAGVELHGFLAYLGKCVATGRPYRIYGYQGLQVRCNIHAQDLVRAFLAFHESPRPGAVYNIGGGRDNSCSMLEAIAAFQEICGVPDDTEHAYEPEPRIGDHRWWVSSNAAFETDYPDWSLQVSLSQIYADIAMRYA